MTKTKEGYPEGDQGEGGDPRIPSSEDDPATKPAPSGLCPRCGRVLDDHEGWLRKKEPVCPI